MYGFLCLKKVLSCVWNSRHLERMANSSVLCAFIFRFIIQERKIEKKIKTYYNCMQHSCIYLLADMISFLYYCIKNVCAFLIYDITALYDYFIESLCHMTSYTDKNELIKCEIYVFLLWGWTSLKFHKHMKRSVSFLELLKVNAFWF